MFADTEEALCKTVRTHGMSGGRRMLVIINAPTTRDSAVLAYLDVVNRLYSLADGFATKFRVVVLVGRRFALLGKVIGKFRTTFPTWHALAVQVARYTCQSLRREPGYAVLAGSSEELGTETPTEITIGRGPPGCARSQGCLLRCCSTKCPLRPEENAPAAACVVKKKEEKPATEVDELDREEDGTGSGTVGRVGHDLVRLQIGEFHS